MILPKISGYIKTFIVKDKNNKLMSIGINDEKLLGKYKVTWTMIELNALPVYDDGYTKTKIRTYDDKVCISFHGLNVPDGTECEFFTDISFDSYIQVYLGNCAYRIIDKWMIDYLDKDLFETDEEYICCNTIELI